MVICHILKTWTVLIELNLKVSLKLLFILFTTLICFIKFLFLHLHLQLLILKFKLHQHIILMLMIDQWLVVRWHRTSTTQSNRRWISTCIRVVQTWSSLVIWELWSNTLLIVTILLLLIHQCINHIVGISHKRLIYRLRKVLLPLAIVIGLLHGTSTSRVVQELLRVWLLMQVHVLQLHLL